MKTFSTKRQLSFSILQDWHLSSLAFSRYYTTSNLKTAGLSFCTILAILSLILAQQKAIKASVYSAREQSATHVLQEAHTIRRFCLFCSPGRKLSSFRSRCLWSHCHRCKFLFSRSADLWCESTVSCSWHQYWWHENCIFSVWMKVFGKIWNSRH